MTDRNMLPFWPDDGAAGWEFWADNCYLNNADFTSFVFTTVPEWVGAWHAASWGKKRALVFARHQDVCLYCERPTASHADHLMPRSKGGRDDWWNLVAACRNCNLSKHAHLVEWADEWRHTQIVRVSDRYDRGYAELLAA